MTKDEFMYDHDIHQIVDLLNRHIKYLMPTAIPQSKPVKKVTNPREFFL